MARPDGGSGTLDGGVHGLLSRSWLRRVGGASVEVPFPGHRPGTLELHSDVLPELQPGHLSRQPDDAPFEPVVQVGGDQPAAW